MVYPEVCAKFQGKWKWVQWYKDTLNQKVEVKQTHLTMT